MKRPKAIYLVHRNKELSPSAFVQRWKAHGQLAMSLPIWRNMWRYMHCNPVKMAPGSPHWDGVGIVWYRSWESLDSIAKEPSLRQPLLDDELLTFSGHVRNSAVLTEETVLRDGPETNYIIMLFYSAAIDPSKLAAPGMTRICRSDRVYNGYTQQSILPYIGVLEYWFPSIVFARHAFSRLTAGGLERGADALLVRTRLLYSE